LYEIFTDRFTHFGNLFAFFGNAELSNKMASYPAITKCCFPKPFTLLMVLVLMWKGYRGEFSVRVGPPPRDTIYRIVKQFEETGSVCDTHAKGRQHYAPVLTHEVTGAAREAVT
jgi:hypothetical protein